MVSYWQSRGGGGAHLTRPGAAGGAPAVSSPPPPRAEPKFELRTGAPRGGGGGGAGAARGGPRGGPPRPRRSRVAPARRDGRWLLDPARGEEEPLVRPHDRLKVLEWMLGEWTDEGSDAVTRTSCAWSKDG